MNAQELQKLKELALAATPGPWIRTICDHKNYTQHAASVMSTGCDEIGYPVIADIPPRTTHGTHDANADFIAAANPAAILELIAIAERTSSAGSAVVMSDEQILQTWAQYRASAVGKGGMVPDPIEFARAILSAAAPLYSTDQAPAQTAAVQADQDQSKWKAAYEEKQRQFTAETLRTSQQAQLLSRIRQWLKDRYHCPDEPWAKSGTCCEFVREIAAMSSEGGAK